MEVAFRRIRERFPDWDPAFPKEWRAATLGELQALELEYGFTFPPSFMAFQTTEGKRTPMGNRAWDGFGFATSDAQPHQRLSDILESAKKYGVKPFLIPFHYEEGTFRCFDTRTRRADGECPVVFWDHMEGIYRDGLIEGDHVRFVDFVAWLNGTFDDL